MSPAEDPAPYPVRPGGAREALRTVASFAVAFALISAMQFGIVLGLRLRPIMFVLPALVGAVCGALVASVRAARARERRIAMQLASAQASRFEAMSRLAGGVGHDLGNVYAVATACSVALRAGAAPSVPGCAACLSALDDLDAALERARGISRQLVMLARPPGPAPAPVDAAAVLRALAPMLRRAVGDAVRLDVAAPDAAHVGIDRTELEQVALNLAANARDAMPGGGTLSIRVAREGGRIRLAVRDTGGGMDEPTRARMFEPFFTTKPAGKGTGLGLMVVAHVVQRAGGDIAVSSAPGAGTEIAVTFPEAAAAPSRAAAG